MALAAAFALGTMGVALGTLPGGPPAIPTVLADVITVNTVNANAGPIRLSTSASVEVFQVSNRADPGWSAGWHSHTGPVIITLTEGSLTFYQLKRSDDEGEGDDRNRDGGSSCQVTTVSAPGGFIEPPGQPMQVVNAGTTTAAWITTQIIPVLASKRVDVSPGFCGV